MVMFAPGGIAGLLMMHAPLLEGPRTIDAAACLGLSGRAGRRRWRCSPASSWSIEMTYHLTVKASEGTIDHRSSALRSTAPSADAWVAAAVLVVGGFWLSRMTWPVVGQRLGRCVARRARRAEQRNDRARDRTRDVHKSFGARQDHPRRDLAVPRASATR